MRTFTSWRESLVASFLLSMAIVTAGCGDLVEDGSQPADSTVETVEQPLLATCGPWGTSTMLPSRWWLLRSNAWVEDSTSSPFPFVFSGRSALNASAFGFYARENHRTLRVGFRISHPLANQNTIHLRIPYYGITIALSLPNTWPANTFGYWTIDPAAYGVPSNAGRFWYQIDFTSPYISGVAAYERVCNRVPACPTGQELEWQLVTDSLTAREIDTGRLLQVSAAQNGTYVGWDHWSIGSQVGAEEHDVSAWWYDSGSPPPVAVRVSALRTEECPFLVMGSYAQLGSWTTTTRRRIQDTRNTAVSPTTPFDSLETWFYREGATTATPGWDIEIRREGFSGFVSFFIERLDCTP